MERSLLLRERSGLQLITDLFKMNVLRHEVTRNFDPKMQSLASCSMGTVKVRICWYEEKGKEMSEFYCSSYMRCRKGKRCLQLQSLWKEKCLIEVSE